MENNNQLNNQIMIHQFMSKEFDEWYSLWVLEECDSPRDEIEYLCSLLTEEQKKEIRDSIPSWANQPTKQ